MVESVDFRYNIMQIINHQILQNKMNEIAASGTSTPVLNNLKPMVALPSVSYSTPDVVWYQTDDFIKFDIMLPDVEVYSATVLRKSIFCFR